MMFIKYGIHTRLYYLIKGSGGLDREARRNYLTAKYGFDEETISMILMYDVEHLLTKNNIDELKSLIIQKNKDKKLKTEGAMANLLTMISNLCCNSNMFY